MPSTPTVSALLCRAASSFTPVTVASRRRQHREEKFAHNVTRDHADVVRRYNRAGLGAPTLPRRLALTGSLLAAFTAASFVPGKAMAWRSSGRSNNELIDNLYNNNVITDKEIAHVMKSVDRKNYVVPGSGDPYQDSPLPIGYGATISAPHMHAHCLDILSDWLKPGAKVLDVGSGTGYLTALFSELVSRDGGVVVGIDHIPELVNMSRQNFKKDGRSKMLDAGEVVLVTGDGRLVGCVEPQTLFFFFLNLFGPVCLNQIEPFVDTAAHGFIAAALNLRE